MGEAQIHLGDHWAFFGDGNCAQIVDSKEYIKKDTGVKYLKFIFIPSILIEQMFDIKDLIDPKTHAMIREYPASEVIWLQRGVSRSRCWILPDYMGNPTPASRKYQELTETLDDTERLLRSAEGAKNRAYQELEKERQQQMQALRTKVQMVREVAKARGRVDEEQMIDGTGDMPPDNG